MQDGTTTDEPLAEGERSAQKDTYIISADWRCSSCSETKENCKSETSQKIFRRWHMLAGAAPPTPPGRWVAIVRQLISCQVLHDGYWPVGTVCFV